MNRREFLKMTAGTTLLLAGTAGGISRIFAQSAGQENRGGANFRHGADWEHWKSPRSGWAVCRWSDTMAADMIKTK